MPLRIAKFGVITLTPEQQFIASMNAIIGNSNMVRFFLFNKMGSETTIPDLSPNKLDCTLSNAANTMTPIVSGNAKALTFNGTSHFFMCPTDVSLDFGNGSTDQPFSKIAICRPTSNTSRDIFGSLDNTTGAKKGRTMLSYLSNSKLCLSVYNPDPNTAYIGRVRDTVVDDSTQMRCFAATYSGSKTSAGAKLYVDGTNVDTANYQAGTYVGMNAVSLSAGNYHILSGGTVKGNFFKGEYVAMCLCKGVLTQAQVTAIQTAMKLFCKL